MTKDKKTELALKAANMIRNWNQTLCEMHTLYVSDLGDMEALSQDIQMEYGFRPPKDNEGNPQGWMPLVAADDPNAWHYEGDKEA